jgi:Ca2+-binding EF-hand superfamily protein
MSIGSVGSSPGSGASQYLAELLSRLKASSTTSTDASSSTTSTTSSSSSDSSQTDTSNAATGASAPTLSDQVISALVMMQAQNGGPPAAGSAPSDPLSQAFTSLDTNGDGTLSQSELETAIQNAGGTADEADTVFSALGGTASSGITEGSFAQAAQQAGPPPGGPGGPQGAHHHHGHHHAQSQDASASADSIFSAMDTNGDGSVSTDELTAALQGTTGSSGTASGSATSSSDIFASIDSNGDGSISATELQTYISNLQQQSQSDQSQLAGFMQMATQAYGNAASMFSSQGAQAAMA